VLEKLPAKNLRVYVVWMPVLGKDDEAAAALAAATMTDPRVRHFWNPDMSIGHEASRAMGVQEQLDPAWDVFVMYGKEAAWKGPGMPAPSGWLHRVAEQDPRWMEPDKLLRALGALLRE